MELAEQITFASGICTSRMRNNLGQNLTQTVGALAGKTAVGLLTFLLSMSKTKEQARSLYSPDGTTSKRPSGEKSNRLRKEQ